METNILYEVLRLYRNSIFTNFDNYYSNAELYQLAENPPKTKDDFQKILPDQQKYDKYGKKFLELIKLFEPSGRADSITTSSRRNLEYFEIALHDYIIKLLKNKFSENWWYAGVPTKIRIKAAELHENSEGAIPKENCLYLNDLKEIIVIRWEDFSEKFDPEKKGKKTFESSFFKLNDIRNRLGHPIRLKDKPITEEESELIASWLQKIKS